MFLIIVTKLQKDAANKWVSENVDIGEGGMNTFTVPLYTGTNHTHYVACFQSLTQEQLTDMDAHFTYTYDVADSKDVQDVYKQRGLNLGEDK